MTTTTSDILPEVRGPVADGREHILTEEALRFVGDLHRRFDPRRRELLERRAERDRKLAAGEIRFGFLDETRDVREGDWKVADAPADLNERKVEITGPADRKMMINALNSGSSVFMADLEDALSPTWENVLQGQVNLYDAVRRQIAFEDEEKGKSYELEPEIATLLVRPRGWHLVDQHVLVDGDPISASILDFGLYFFHNAQELVDRGSGPYFYLAKLESHLEARLWNDVFVAAQEELGIDRGTVRATVLLETLPAAWEMEEILYELREHSAGLNAGRWDYIFSAIRIFRFTDTILPDRGRITMTVPFMRAYTELLVHSCHKRGAHAIGGMSAFIPTGKDPEVNERALAEVREDKQREADDGCDGSWIAHPGLVDVVRPIFDQAIGADRPHQKRRTRDDVSVSADDLQDFRVPGEVTEEGVRTNVRVAIQYLDAWFSGWGAAAIDHKMEDTATAEISRAQLWQWVNKRAKTAGGDTVDREYYERIRDEELAGLEDEPTAGHRDEATRLLDELVLSDDFVLFLTLPGYDRLTELHGSKR